ncbi:MAG: hypothetical protein NXI27_08375 [Alphaproteobacteria bacterium]|nr:hypothetical protein [Alphaproteobacteria bacterium]
MRCAVSSITATAAIFPLLLVLCAAPPAAAETGQFDNAGLVEMLENLGYEPTENKYPNGYVFQEITGSVPGLNWTMNVSVNPDTKLLWAEMDFWPLEEGQNFPYDVLLEVLERNFQLDTMRFMYLTRSRKFRLAGSQPVRGLKPIHVRKLIEEAVNEAAKTTHLWNPNNWRQQDADDMTAKAPEKETGAVAEKKPTEEASE